METRDPDVPSFCCENGKRKVLKLKTWGIYGRLANVKYTKGGPLDTTTEYKQQYLQKKTDSCHVPILDKSKGKERIPPPSEHIT